MKIESCSGLGLVTISYTEEEGKLSVEEFTDRLYDFVRQEMPHIRHNFEIMPGMGIPGHTVVKIRPDGLGDERRESPSVSRN